MVGICYKKGRLSSNPGNTNNARNVNYNGNVNNNDTSDASNNGLRAASQKYPVLLD